MWPDIIFLRPNVGINKWTNVYDEYIKEECSDGEDDGGQDGESFDEMMFETGNLPQEYVGRTDDIRATR